MLSACIDELVVLVNVIGVADIRHMSMNITTIGNHGDGPYLITILPVSTDAA